jgi:nucleoside 2-deoxyribosyltransferase
VKLSTDISIYLAGPIDCAADLGVKWRAKFTEILELNFPNIIIFDPTLTEVGKEYAEIQKLKLEANTDKSAFIPLRNKVKAIIDRDLDLISQSSIVVASMDNITPSAGTTHEIIYAVSNRIPVILLSPKKILSCPTWLLGLIDLELVCQDYDEVIDKITQYKNVKFKGDTVSVF